MLRWFYRAFGRFWYLFIIAIMVVSFLIVAKTKKDLQVYDPESGKSIYTIEKETETEKEIISETYRNETINFTMQIPDGWEKVIKGGYDTFVHAPSASSIQVQVLSYYPMVNNVTDASLQETLTESGYTLTEFDYIGDNGYYDIYQGLNNTGAVDYIEHVFWDRSHVVKILAIVNDVNYAKIKDELWFAINSAEWTYEDPITPGYYLNYQLYGDFEFAIPDTWQFSSTDSSLYAYDEQSGAMMTVNVLEDSSMLSDITQIDYNNFLSAGKSNFMLNVFQQYSDYIYGEATYDNNGVATALAQTYYANGTYQYIITYEFPTAYADPYYQISVDGLSLTRIFYDSGNETESTDTAQSDSSESIMGKTFGAGTAQETTPKETEPSDGRAIGTFSLDDQKNNPSQRYGNLDNLMDEDSSQEDFDRKFDKYSSSEASSQPADGTQEAPAGNTDAGVSTVADAFVQVAGISQEKAQALSSAWYSLNLGDPVEAEAYKGNDTSLILLVTNQVGVDYYIYITKEGDLQDIRMNNEEGPSVLNSQPQQ